jgi:HupE / UreJ protein
MRASSATRWAILVVYGLAWMVSGVSIAIAHTGGTTGYAAILISGRGIRYSLTLSPAGLPTPVVEELRLAQAGARPSRERLLRMLGEKITMLDRGARCLPGPGFFERSPFGVETVTLVLDFGCAAPPRNLTIRDDLFDVLGADHHTLAKIQGPDGTRQFAFTPDTREAHFAFETAGDNHRWSGSFLLLGIHHILSGYDHLIFLFGLLLRGGGVVSLLKIITAFTVAHSVTLALAVLDVITLPDRLVESVIALSIAYIAAENLLLGQASARRWLVSFLFGLVHGFGFSSALRELGLPRQGLLWSLFGFNLGVEAGQAMVVALALPGLLLLRRSRWEGRLVSSCSLAILLIGLALFVERLLLT